MDRKQLALELEDFKNACIAISAIREDSSKDGYPAFEFDEVYQGVFIINLFVKDEWLSRKYEADALKELIELLYKETEPKTRESILTLRLCSDAGDYTIQYEHLEDGKEKAA